MCGRGEGDIHRCLLSSRQGSTGGVAWQIACSTLTTDVGIWGLYDGTWSVSIISSDADCMIPATKALSTTAKQTDMLSSCSGGIFQTFPAHVSPSRMLVVIPWICTTVPMQSANICFKKGFRS